MLTSRRKIPLFEQESEYLAGQGKAHYKRNGDFWLESYELKESLKLYANLFKRLRYSRKQNEIKVHDIFHIKDKR